VADGFETIGWVLSIEDEATGPVIKVQKLIDEAVKKTAKAADVVLQTFTTKAEEVPVELVKFYSGMFGKVAAKWHDFGDGFVKHWDDTSKKVKNVSGMLADIGAETIPKLLNMVTALGDEMKRAFDGKNYAKAFTVLVKHTRAAIPVVNDFLQKFISIEKITNAFKLAGGVAGIFLGPFAALFRLFEPLIKMFTEAFMPAMTSFTAIIQSAFGPLTQTLDIIATNIAMKLLPHISKLTVIAELLAVQFGAWVTELIDSGFLEDMIDAVVDLAVESLPMMMDALMEIGKVFKEVGPEMLKAFLEIARALLPLIPDLTEIAVTILRDVMLPTLKAIVPILRDDVIPFIKEWLPPLVTLLKDAADQFKQILGMSKAEWGGAFSDIFSPFTNFSKWLDTPAGSVVKTLLNPFGAAADTMKKAFNLFSTPDTPAPRLPMIGATGVATPSLPPMADGAAMVNRPVIAGEAGPEMILPLNRSTVERVLLPLLPKIEMPGQEAIQRVLERIDDKLGGKLRVDGGASAVSVSGGDGGLSMAVGMDGVGAW